QLESLDGRMLARFEILYHVIPRAQFEVLFAAHAQPTREGEAENPYLRHRESPPCTFEGDDVIAELGAVDPDACLGHFVGYPAYPVSIMARDAVAAVA